MIIPIKCFTCGKVLADKYNYFLKRVREIKEKEGLDIQKVIYLTEKNNWQSEWGGQIALKKEIERKTLYENKYSPYDGLMLIVNNANPLVYHKITALHNKNVNRYTFSFYYSIHFELNPSDDTNLS